MFPNIDNMILGYYLKTAMASWASGLARLILDQLILKVNYGLTFSHHLPGLHEPKRVDRSSSPWPEVSLCPSD